MKRVTIPPPVETLGTVEGKPSLIQLSLGLHLRLHVWPSPYWRTGGSDKIRCAIRLAEIFENRNPGDEVDLSDRDHEMLVECALMHGQALGDAVAIPVLKLICALTDAQDVKAQDQS